MPGMSLTETQTSLCPHCGFSGPPASECPRCGIIYAKYRRIDGTHTPESSEASPPTPVEVGSSPKRFTLLPWLMGLLAVAAVAIAFDAGRREEHAATGSRPAAAKPSATQSSELLAEKPSSPMTVEVPRALDEAEWVQPEDLEPVAAAEPEARPTLTPSFTWYEGASGFQRGIEEADREGKALAVYFYTDWCPYCRELESELLGRARVEEYLKYLVKIRINPETGNRERLLANQYGVRGYPSFFIQVSPAAAPTKIRRTTRDGLKTPEQFVETLERAAG